MYLDKGLLNYCWKYKMFPSIRTTKGIDVEVLDQGLHNRNADAPTFFNAKVKLNGTLYVGNVMTLLDASNWSYRQHDSKFDNVILVICDHADSEVFNSKGESIPVAQVYIPENVERNAAALLGIGGDVSCHHRIMEYTSVLLRHSWLAAMQTEFLEEESDYLKRFYKESGSDLEKTFFVAILRAYGFVVNKTAMDLLARNVSVKALELHRDDLFQVESIIMGQAGLLNIEQTVQSAVPEKFFDKAMKEGYLPKLRNEWLYLKHKFNMPLEISRLAWCPYGNGGLNYPNVYLSMLANWWYCRKMDSKTALHIKTAKEAMNLFNTHCTPYWETHYVFGSESSKCVKSLSDDRKAWLVMAGLVPFMFFYGRLTNNEELCDRAFDFMEQVKTFSTTETNHFKKYGVIARDAGEALALTHLKNNYCCQQMKPGADARECLRCRFGHEFIKKN